MGKFTKPTAADVLASKKAKKRRRRKFGLKVDFKQHVARVHHRPPFNSAASQIAVNRDATHGLVEDRRHMVHWDETLKPMVESTLSALMRAFPIESVCRDVLYDAMKDAGISRLTKGRFSSLAKRFAKEVNSVPFNLVPDDAATNQAIEKVRQNVRNYHVALMDAPTLRAAFEANNSHHAIMTAFKQAAVEHFDTTRNSTPITAKISDINGVVLRMMNGCMSPVQIWHRIHEVQHSVTFDLSQKARRDQTEKTMRWERAIKGVMENGDAREMLAGMLLFVNIEDS